MTGVWLAVALSVVTGLLVNEICDISPWLALRMVRRAARLWSVGDPMVAEAYGEEWAAIIADCPGKLSKMVRAAGFLGGATLKASRYRIGRLRRRSLRVPFEWDVLEVTYFASESILEGVASGDTVTLRFENSDEWSTWLGEHPKVAGRELKVRWLNVNG
ncbi:hypothetical protein [Actinoplanes sp. NPDC049599]|uniref:hypothetical protein n=1 Tax=Actinoplanes sp. NPDC049599 TaxID=3363903 RepID=UPI0037BD1F1B